MNRLCLKTLARYGYIQNRLDDSARSLLNYIAFADGIDGVMPLSAFRCDQAPELAKTVSACEDIKKTCLNNKLADDNAANFEKSAKDHDISGIELAMTKIDQQVSHLNSRVSGPMNAAKVAKIAELKKMKAIYSLRLSQFYSAFPWAGQDTFKKLKNQGKDTKIAMKAQIRENAENAMKQLDQINQSSRCLLRDSCKDNELNEALAMTDPMTETLAAVPGESKSDAATRGSIGALMSYNNCLDETKKSQSETSEELWSAAIGTVGAIATGGGSLLLTGFSIGSKVAIGAAKAGTKFANSGRAAAVFGQSMDTFFTVDQLNKLSANCVVRARAQPTTQTSDKTSCGILSAQTMEFKKAHDDCVMQLALAGLGLPLGAIGLKSLLKAKTVNIEKFEDLLKKETSVTNKNKKQFQTIASGLTNKERIEVAEAIVSQNAGKPVKLTKTQSDAVIEAHNVGLLEGRGYSTYTAADKKRKLEILKAAGFSEKDRRDLMAAGVTGRIEKIEIGNIADGVMQTPQMLLNKYEEDAFSAAASGSDSGWQAVISNFKEAAKVSDEIRDSRFIYQDALYSAVSRDLSAVKMIRANNLEDYAEEVTETLEALSKAKTDALGTWAGKPFVDLVKRENDHLKDAAQDSLKWYRTGDYPHGKYEAWQTMRARLELIRKNDGKLGDSFDKYFDAMKKELDDFVVTNNLQKDVAKWEKAIKQAKGL